MEVDKKEIEMIPLAWNKDFLIGDAKVDDAHEKLFYLINRIITAKEEGFDKDFIKSSLYDFVEYAYSHFEDEERFMREIDYPNYLEHQKIHQKLTEQVEEFLALYKANSLDIDAFVYFVKDWLVNHILKVDMLIMEYKKTIDNS